MISPRHPLRARALVSSLSSLAILLGIASTAGSAAATPAAPAVMPSAKTSLDPRVLERALALPAGALSASRTLPSPYGDTQRFVQLHGGVPVLGAGLAVRVDGAGVRTQTDALAHGLRVDTTPKLSADAARTKAASFGKRPVRADAPARLVVIPQVDLGGYLAWEIDAWRTSRGPLRLYVDAHDGTILSAHSLVTHARGRIFATDPSAMPIDHDLPYLTSATALEGRAASIANFVSGDMEKGETLVFDETAKPDMAGDYLFEPEKSFDLTDAFAQVNAYYHIDAMDSFFRNSLGVPMGYGLEVVVNYAPGGAAYDNAFFSPYKSAHFDNVIVIGEGSKIDFAYDSDVFMHEFTHYVNANTVTFNDGSYGDQYGLNPMPGALDEGTADYFACTVNDDPILGGSALAAVGGQRDLTKNPGRCPEVVFGEPHMDGGLVGNATWRIRQALGRDVGDPLIWSSIQLLHGGATFADFAGGILKGTDAAVAKGTMTAAKAAEVKAILDDLGLTGCGRAVDVTPKAPAVSGFTGLTLLGRYFGGYSCDQLSTQVKMTSLFQHRFVAGANDKYAKLSLALAPAGFGGGGGGGSDTLDYSLYVRKGNLVTFTGNFGGGQPYKARTYDYKVEHLADANGSIALGPTGVGPLEPGATYYLAVLHANCPTMQGTVSVETLEVAPEADAGVDAGIDAAGSDVGSDAGSDAGSGASLAPDAMAGGGGCACETAPGGGTRAPRAPLGALGALGALASALVVARRAKGARAR
jgi:hypothetical protein